MAYKNTETYKAAYIKRIEMRRENGLCISCGRKKERDDVVSCNTCIERTAERQRSNRKFYASIGICPKCFKNKLYGSEKSCIDCKAKEAEYKRCLVEKNREEYNAKIREYNKIVYRKRKEEGICTRCGKEKAAENKAMCSRCGELQRQRHNKGKILRFERANYGLCYRCGNKLDRDGKLCESCADQNRINGRCNVGKSGWKNNNFVFGR